MRWTVSVNELDECALAATDASISAGENVGSGESGADGAVAQTAAREKPANASATVA